MTKRILAALFGAVIFGIVVPIAWLLIFKSVPLGGLKGIVLLIAGGMGLGALLGALFPRVFGFIAEMCFLSDR